MPAKCDYSAGSLDEEFKSKLFLQSKLTDKFDDVNCVADRARYSLLVSTIATPRGELHGTFPPATAQVLLSRFQMKLPRTKEIKCPSAMVQNFSANQ